MIVGSGTFVIGGMSLDTVQTSDGFVVWTDQTSGNHFFGAGLPQLPDAFPGWQSVGLSGNNHAGSWSLSFPTGSHCTLTLVGTGIGVGSHFIDNPPNGFTPTTNIKGHGAGSASFIAPGGGEAVNVDWGLGSSSLAGPTAGLVAIPDAAFPDNSTFTSLIACLLNVTANVVGQPLTSGSDVGTGNSPSIIGNYTIIYYWWIKHFDTTNDDGNNAPERSVPCNEPQSSELQLSPTSPGADFARLDPLDPNAAPTVIITSLEPDHGFSGQAVTIRGSGFGDGAVVKFDALSASSVVVVDQYTITCVAPTHAAGTTDVVVTNLDGGHS